jgi:hypothetical protein
MNQSASRYADWKAPADDGQILIWPDPSVLLRDTRDNLHRLNTAHAVRLQGIALPELRRAVRTWIGHESIDQPLIVTGHQTELEHPGVWVKNVLLHVASQKLDGHAFHVAVDTDAPKHLQLRWPGESIPVTDDPGVSDAAWSGLLDPPSPQHVAAIERRLAEASTDWDFEPMLPQVLSSLRRLALESLHLPNALINAVHELEWSLGLRHHALMASPLWASEPFFVFAHHLLADAARFAAKYNAALGAYRKETGTRSTTRPMPDLFIGPDACEVPFWIDDLAAAQRRRPSVVMSDGAWTLQLPGGECFRFAPGADGWDAAKELRRWLVANRMRLSPRALTLTMFLRLAAADQFIHGIGGGRYDQVTDRIIASYFGVDPPRFALTTATLFFPQAVSQPRVCVPCVVFDGHRLKHSLLGQRKMAMVEQIRSAPRGSAQRGELFAKMHQQLHAAALQSPQIQAWEQRLRETQEREIAEQTLFDRELFFAIQPRHRLEALISQFRQRFADAS